MKTLNIEGIKDFEINDELYNFLKKIYNVEKILNNDEIRYLFLVSLISSDNSVDEESAKKLMDDLHFLDNNLKYMTLSDEIREEVEKYIIKGKKIINHDIKDFKKESNKEKKKSEKLEKEIKSLPGYNGYEEGFDGIANKTFEF